MKAVILTEQEYVEYQSLMEDKKLLKDKLEEDYSIKLRQKIEKIKDQYGHTAALYSEYKEDNYDLHTTITRLRMKNESLERRIYTLINRTFWRKLKDLFK